MFLGIAEILTLTMGGLVLGLIEGGLIASVHGMRASRTIRQMLIANYVSIILSALGLAAARPYMEHLGLDEGWSALQLSVVAFLAITAIIEFPFVYACFSRRRRKLRRALVSTVLLQTLSAAMTIGWLSLPSSYSLYTETDILDGFEVLSEDNRQATLYFISVQDGHVWRTPLDRSEPPAISHDLGASSTRDRLYAVHADERAGWELRAVYDYDRDRLLDPLFATGMVSTWESELSGERPKNSALNYDEFADMRPASSRGWHFSNSIGIGKTLSGVNRDLRRAFSLALETPLISWDIRNVIILPDSQLIFQLGERICVYDPMSAKLGQICLGRGPLVVFEVADIVD